MTTTTLPPKVKQALIRVERSIAGIKGGSTTSPKKAKSSAKNGALGGRPRKKVAA